MAQESNLGPSLVWLMRRVPAPDGNPYTAATLQAALEDLDVSVSLTYIGHLRQGVAQNPSSRIVQGLAEIFHVPPAFFHDAEVAQQWIDRIDEFDRRKRELMQEWARQGAQPPPLT